jgi:hypothetical protein
VKDEEFKPLAYTPDGAAKAPGRPRSRIFEAMRKGELAARKDGKAVIIEAPNLLGWIRSFPVRKTQP